MSGSSSEEIKVEAAKRHSNSESAFIKNDELDVEFPKIQKTIQNLNINSNNHNSNTDNRSEAKAIIQSGTKTTSSGDETYDSVNSEKKKQYEIDKLKMARIWTIFVTIGYTLYMIVFYTNRSKQNIPSLGIEISIAVMNISLISSLIISYWNIKFVYILLYIS